MHEDKRWVNEDALPDDVKASMRDVLVQAMAEAALTDDPGDGSMLMLGAEKMLGKGDALLLRRAQGLADIKRRLGSFTQGPRDKPYEALA